MFRGLVVLKMISSMVSFSRIVHWLVFPRLKSLRSIGVSQGLERSKLEKSTGHEKFLAAGIRVKTKDGGYYENRVDEPKGDDLFTPLTSDEKREKFINNVIFSKTISLENAKKALMLLKNLEKVDDIAEIITWLV